MKKFRILAIMTALLLCGAFVSAQTADEVIAKYIQAIGGKEQLSKITSLCTESKASAMGMDITMKSTVLNGKGFKMDMDIMGSVITTCITEKGGWSINPMAGGTSAEDMPEVQYNTSKYEIFIGAPFTIYAEKGFKAELAGNETIDSINAIKVKLTAPDNTVSTHFFDPATGYLVKTISQGEMQGQMVENTITFSDYRQVDGFAIPYTTNMNMGGMIEISSTVTKAEVNKPVDEAIFVKP